jgi:hypothetical protein
MQGGQGTHLSPEMEVPELQQDYDATAKGNDRILTPPSLPDPSRKSWLHPYRPKYFVGVPIRNHELSPLWIRSTDDQTHCWRRVVTFVSYWPETVSLSGVRHRIWLSRPTSETPSRKDIRWTSHPPLMPCDSAGTDGSEVNSPFASARRIPFLCHIAADTSVRARGRTDAEDFLRVGTRPQSISRKGRSLGLRPGAFSSRRRGRHDSPAHPANPVVDGGGVRFHVVILPRLNALLIARFHRPNISSTGIL